MKTPVARIVFAAAGQRGPLPALRRGGQASAPGNAAALQVQRIRAGDHLSLFPRRWNYVREYE